MSRRRLRHDTASLREPLQLHIDDLSLRAGGHAGQRLLFERLQCHVGSGEFWAVLGPNGAGKSSLLAAIAGVFAIHAGQVLMQGKPLSAWAPAELADWRAWCPQFWSDPFACSVRETASMAMHRSPWWEGEADSDSAQVNAMLDALDLASLAEADVCRLSSGERQRVAIATAMLQGTPLVLLDEPASHLDLAHQQLLYRLLARERARGRAVMASLHDLNLAWDFATHAVLLDGAGGANAGARDEVMTPANLSRLFGVGVERVEVCGQARFWIAPTDLVCRP